MCLAVPGRIVQTRGETAIVDFNGNRAEVSRVLTPDAIVHDWVLVHAGFAIARMEEREALETWSYLATQDPSDIRAEYAETDRDPERTS